MKNVTLLIIFSLSTLLSFSQYIEGKVLDAITNEPIVGVHVYVKNTYSGAFTNDRGKYYLKFSSKIRNNDTIYISHIGYKTIKLPYSIKKRKYSIFLIKDVNQLKNIEISSKKYLKPRIHFKNLSSLKRGIHSFGSLLIDNKIYVIGGDSSLEVNTYLKYIDENTEISFYEMLTKSRIFSREIYKGDLLIYDLKENSWEIEENKFRKRAYHNIVFNKSNIYVFGGKRLSKRKKYEYLDDKIEVYDVNKKTIAIDHTNPHQAVDFASFLYGDKLIVMGGSVNKKRNGLKEFSNKVHLFDISTGLWHELGNMPIAKELKGILIEDKFFLVGGFKRKPMTGIESFDLKTQKWKKEGDLFQGISKPALTQNDNIIYIFDNGIIVTYNILTKELNEYLIDLPLEASELYYADNKLYILGGFKKNNYSFFPSRGLYSIDLNEFENTKIHRSKKL